MIVHFNRGGDVSYFDAISWSQFIPMRIYFYFRVFYHIIHNLMLSRCGHTKERKTEYKVHNSNCYGFLLYMNIVYIK